MARETGAKSVSVIAHSMGNQLLLPVLRDLKRAAPPSVAISQVILAAPDVDRDAFENIARELVGVSRGVTMLAAGNDRALSISRRFWGGLPRAGDVPANGPIVVEGVDTIDVTAISTVLFALNHSGYAERSALLQDIQLLIQTGERPPDKRVPILERVKTDRGELLALSETEAVSGAPPSSASTTRVGSQSQQPQADDVAQELAIPAGFEPATLCLTKSCDLRLRLLRNPPTSSYDYQG